jgi:hypothetical protein
MQNLCFYLALVFILIHEMDAIRLKEWRMFIFLSKMEEEMAYIIFTALHIPLYFVLFLCLGNSATVLHQDTIWYLDVFFIVHFGLHIIFLWHKNNLFRGVFSWIVISAAGFFGFVDLLLG